MGRLTDIWAVTFAAVSLSAVVTGCHNERDPRVFEDEYIYLRVPDDWKFGPGHDRSGVMLAPQSWSGDPPRPAITIQYRQSRDLRSAAAGMQRGLLEIAVTPPEATSRVIGGVRRAGFVFTADVDGEHARLEIYVVASRRAVYLFALAKDSCFPQDVYQSVLDTVRLKR